VSEPGPSEGAESETVTQAPPISPATESAAEPPTESSTDKLMRELEEASKLITPPPTTGATPERLIDREVAPPQDQDVAATPRPVRRWRLFAAMSRRN
jgi:hypothetical protein